MFIICIIDCVHICFQNFLKLINMVFIFFKMEESLGMVMATAENKIVRHLSLWCLFSVQDAGRDGRWPAVLRHVESEAGPTPQRPVYDYSWAGGPDV
jgi:hypothetical protein